MFDLSKIFDLSKKFGLLDTLLKLKNVTALRKEARWLSYELGDKNIWHVTYSRKQSGDGFFFFLDFAKKEKKAQRIETRRLKLLDP